MARHLRNSRRLEKPRDLDLDLRDLVHVAENASGQERVSAQCEEVIVDTDLLDLEDLRPELRPASSRAASVARRRPAPRRSAGRETQFSRQADPLHFAGRAFWDFPDDEHLARDLEVGDAPDGELTNVFRRRRSVGPQHDGRRDVLAQRGMGDGKGYGLRHRRMFQEHFVDFPRGDFLPAAIDHLPYAAGEKQVPVVIEETKIPGLEPIACKCGLGRRSGCRRSRAMTLAPRTTTCPV